jgi:glycosyltransferase involved in cell wall biosynthesis
VHWLGYVSDAERRDLLAGATLLAYPSLYEGFGLPPLEAMAAGIPVVAASSGAIPEVVDDAALLVAPDDDAELAEGIASLVHDEALRAQLVDAGKRRAAMFDWETAASNFVALYTDVAERR